jgi:hypothetical protein
MLGPFLQLKAIYLEIPFPCHFVAGYAARRFWTANEVECP